MKSETTVFEFEENLTIIGKQCFIDFARHLYIISIPPAIDSTFMV